MAELPHINECGYCQKVTIPGDGHKKDYCPQVEIDFDAGTLDPTLTEEQIDEILGLMNGA
jgi:hypothetical protein